MKIRRTLIASAFALALMGASAQAAGNLIQNSGFTDLSGISQVIEGAYNPSYGVYAPTTVTNWSANGTYDLDVLPGQGDSTTALYDGFALYGPANGVNNGMTATGPGGGNYIALDASFPGAFSQTINGLVAGQTYNLSFYFATAQEINSSGDTTEGLTASVGDQSFGVAPVFTPNAGFDPWTLESFNFTYDGAGDLLSFLANGTGEPPYALLNDPTLTDLSTSVPEPATWAMFLVGFGAIGFMVRSSRRKSAAATA